MKVRQNYTQLHLAQLFHCSVATISNIVITFTHVLHEILFDDLMITSPSHEKKTRSLHCPPSGNLNPNGLL